MGIFLYNRGSKEGRDEMKKRVKQIEEVLGYGENSAGVRLKELVEALELEATNQDLSKIANVLYMSPRFKKICVYENSRVITLYRLL